MLYKHFVACMMVCAFFTLPSMIDNQEWQYIILPIGIIIWGIFKFFNDNDRNYLKSQGIDPDKYDSLSNFLFGNDYTEYNPSHHRTESYPPRREGNTVTWDRVEDNFDSNLFKGQSSTADYSKYQPRQTVQTWQNPTYKVIVNKCKRNFKISVNESEKKNDKKERKSFFPSNGSFGW